LALLYSWQNARLFILKISCASCYDASETKRATILAEDGNDQLPGDICKKAAASRVAVADKGSEATVTVVTKIQQV